MSRGQIIYSKLSDTRAYNAYTGSDLGSEMLGYYFELGYDLLTLFTKKQEVKELILFSRYENYDTHHQVAEGIQRNNAFNRTDITTGLTFRVAKGAVFKGDYQYFTNRSSSNDPLGQLNLGIGVWF